LGGLCLRGFLNGNSYMLFLDSARMVLRFYRPLVVVMLILKYRYPVDPYSDDPVSPEQVIRPYSRLDAIHILIFCSRLHLYSAMPYHTNGFNNWLSQPGSEILRSQIYQQYQARPPSEALSIDTFGNVYISCLIANIPTDYDRARLWSSKYFRHRKATTLKTVFALFWYDFMIMTLCSFAVGVVQVRNHFQSRL
jgi:hypothetical protein